MRAELPGVKDVVPIPNGVAVVAEKYWQARQALKSLKVNFDGGANSDVSTETLAAQYRTALDGNVWKTVRAEGAATRGEEMTGKFEEVYSQEYESQFMAHATMEPMNCTASVTEEGCTIWGPWQAKLSKDSRAPQSPYLAKILKTHWLRTFLINAYALILFIWLLLMVS